jgi:plasmid stabilization system protein ParE
VARTTIVWTAPARQDLFHALEYLVQEAKAPQAAADLLDHIETAAASLVEFSERGRIVPELGLPRRELLVDGYRLVYRIRVAVEILRLIHGRQDFLTAWKQERI